MANWEKLIEEHYSKKNKIDEKTIFELIEQALIAEGYQDSEVIKNHPSMRLSKDLLTEGRGEELEAALVAAFNGEVPKHFEDFVKLVAADLKAKHGLSGEADDLKKETREISAFWKLNGGRDTTSKADIKLGGERVSMKLGPSAPLFTFGPGDARATMAVALKMTALGKNQLTKNQLNQANDLNESLSGLETKVVRAPLGVLKKAKGLLKDNPNTTDDADKIITTASGNDDYEFNAVARTKSTANVAKKIKTAKKNKKKSEAILARLKDKTTPAAEKSRKTHTALIGKYEERIKQLEPRDELLNRGGGNSIDAGKQAMTLIKTANDLREHIEEVLAFETKLDDIEAEVIKVMNPKGNLGLTKEYYREALTSRVKFGGLSANNKPEKPDSPNIADSVFITQNEDVINKNIGNIGKTSGNKVIAISDFYKFEKLDDAKIDTIAKAASWRGRFRSDSIKEKVQNKEEKTGYNKLRASISAEITAAGEDGKAYLKGFEDMLVQEGVLSEQELNEIGIGAVLAKGKQAVKSIVAKGAKYWANFMEKLKNIMSSLMGWFEKLVRSISARVMQLTGSIRNAISGGLPKLMELYGIEISDYLDATSEPPASPPAGILFK